MSEDKQLYDLFQSNKTEFADNDFSKRVMSRLPKRNSLLPPLIIFFCLAVGIFLTGWLRGGSSLYEGIQGLGLSLSCARLPSAAEITSYLIFLLLVGCVSVSTLSSYER